MRWSLSQSNLTTSNLHIYESDQRVAKSGPSTPLCPMPKSGPSVPSTPLCRGSRRGMSLLRWSDGFRHRFRDGFRRSFPCVDTLLICRGVAKIRWVLGPACRWPPASLNCVGSLVPVEKGWVLGPAWRLPPASPTTSLPRKINI